MSLQDRVALVTGATAGIGAAVTCADVRADGADGPISRCWGPALHD